MKKLYILIASLTLIIGAQAQQMLSTNIYVSGTHQLSIARAKVYSIEVSSTNAFTYRFYDNDNLTHVPTQTATAQTNNYWGTNFVNNPYISRSTYATNITSSFTNYNGYVVWSTNAGLYTLTTTNAASTNAVAALATISTGGAETRVSYVDALFNRGIIIGSTGAGAITVYYRNE
jgi:hypothetical protein